ncbi:hypothetical protein HYU95_04740 [Candidatus Daviesbacteria bacterium]|nr:hypothetical protein [Candidatus Daviesbacteria bacterium]
MKSNLKLSFLASVIVAVIIVLFGLLMNYPSIKDSLKPRILPVTKQIIPDNNADLFSCQSNSDCIIPQGQCSCSEVAINKDYIDYWSKTHQPQKFCPAVICTSPQATCINNKCAVTRNVK